VAKIGVAVVGLGIGEQHLRAFASLPNCEVKLLIDLDISRARHLASSYNDCDISENFDDAIIRNDIDLISIATYDDMHFEQVYRAIQANKHVFVEKPLCRSEAELLMIEKLLREKPNLHLCSNLVLRGAELFQWLRTEIRSGNFGEIYSFDGDYLYGRLHKITDGWRGRRKKNYSVTLGGGIHIIDLMLFLLEKRPISIRAIGNNICSRDSTFDNNDFVSATMVFKDGCVGRITSNFGCVHKHQHVLRIFGTRRTFILDDQGPRIMLERESSILGSSIPKSIGIDFSPLPHNKGILIPEFVESISQGRRNLAQLSDIFDGIRICLACDQSIVDNCEKKMFLN
jgi:predicted dehydrogenase